MENQLTPNNSMILEIRELLENARKNVAQQVNTLEHWPDYRGV